MLLYQIKLKMDQKPHLIDQEGLKMYEKGKRREFLDLKYLLLEEFSLAELGGWIWCLLQRIAKSFGDITSSKALFFLPKQ